MANRTFLIFLRTVEYGKQEYNYSKPLRYVIFQEIKLEIKKEVAIMDKS
jgi:hypothetical protein